MARGKCNGKGIGRERGWAGQRRRLKEFVSPFCCCCCCRCLFCCCWYH